MIAWANMPNSTSSTPSYLEELNSVQLEAATCLGGAVLVLAGAGSGKTKVLTTRAAYLMEVQGLHPDQILLATFTNKAAKEMSDRILKLTGRRMQFSGTFHKLCVKILRKDGHAIGLDTSFTILDADDQVSLIRSILKSLGYTAKEMNPNMISGMISNAKNELLNPTQYASMARGKYQEVAAKVYPRYERQLNEQRAVDFDNLLNKTLELFEQFPEILARWQTQFEHVLVDEYQDVNKAQYLLSVLLAKPQCNLFCVGDFSQNIYSWRGADYKNMLLLQDEFPDLTEFRLEQNYRSTQSILDAASAVISNNTSHPVLKLWTDKTEGDPLVLFEADSDRDETRYVIDTIRNMNKPYPYSEIAILYRTNAQSRSLEEACLRAGIPYRLIGGTRFYARKEIKDILAYLRVLYNPAETSSIERIQKLGKRQAQAYLSWVESSRAPLVESRPLEILDAVLEQTNYRARFNIELDEDADRVQNIQELRSVASEFEDLGELLENVSLAESDVLPDGASKDSNNAVSLMSMHAAKGLEFSAVIIVGLEEGLFPHSRSLMDREQLEEERRLCYVGITRAKERLFLTYARSRLLYGSITGAVPSRFLAEIPSYVIKRVGVSESYQEQQIRSRFSADETAIDKFLQGEITIDDLLR